MRSRRQLRILGESCGKSWERCAGRVVLDDPCNGMVVELQADMDNSLAGEPHANIMPSKEYRPRDNFECTNLTKRRAGT